MSYTVQIQPAWEAWRWVTVAEGLDYAAARDKVIELADWRTNARAFRVKEKKRARGT